MNNAIKYLVLIIMIFLNSSFGFSQEFINGEFNSTKADYPWGPFDWHSVLHDDPFNQSTDVDDILKETGIGTFDGPDVENGLAGTPYSGDYFLMGPLARFSDGTIIHGGVKQVVYDLEIGEQYIIILHQTVLKHKRAPDTSGSWMVIMDDELIGMGEPSVSHLAVSDTALQWDRREFIFTAKKRNPWISFLPVDDDNNILADSTVLDGALFMGLDLVSISKFTSSIELTPLDIQVYPNPCIDQLSIESPTGMRLEKIKIYNEIGLLVLEKELLGQSSFDIDLRAMKSGNYYIQVFDKKTSQVFTINKL